MSLILVLAPSKEYFLGAADELALRHPDSRVNYSEGRLEFNGNMYAFVSEERHMLGLHAQGIEVWADPLQIRDFHRLYRCACSRMYDPRGSDVH